MDSDAGPFSLLLQLAGDRSQQDLWSAQSGLEGWLAVERALALAQAAEGEMPTEYATAIVDAASAAKVDTNELWASARTVGYPVLGLIRQIADALPEGPAGRVHFGATTQDVMDTALALQMSRSVTLLDHALQRLGDALVDQIRTHRSTVMAARTHAQQAVPTTFGATLATLLAQLTRHRQRLAATRSRVEMVSLFGAGGTSAALGPAAPKVRRRVAEMLGLAACDVPWHVERDGPAEFGWMCATVASACSKLARNVVDLSRTEVGEVHEQFSTHRGASSTMPQKVNPISSEIVIGLSGAANALTPALTRIQEAGHERAAGEWQIEWHVLPQLAVLAGSAVAETIDLVIGLRVDAERMRQNLSLDGGSVLAEALMMRLAAALGQSRSHDLVYAAAERARRDSVTLEHALTDVAAERRVSLPELSISPSDYLGEAPTICLTAIENWTALAPPPDYEAPISTLALAA